MARHFLDDVLLGFQTIESTCAGMVADAMAALARGPDGPLADSDLFSVDLLEEARKLRDPERLRAIGYVSMPIALIVEMKALSRRLDEARQGGHGAGRRR